MSVEKFNPLIHPKQSLLINPQNIDFEHATMGEIGMFHHICGVNYNFRNNAKIVDIMNSTSDVFPEYIIGKCIWSNDPAVEVTPTPNVLEMWAKEKGIL